MDVTQIRSVDDLKQAFADRKEERLAGFVRDIKLAVFADAIGTEGRKAAGDAAGWSATYINRLARLADLPAPLLDPELPLGVYNVVLQHVEDRDKIAALLLKAIEGGWSQADMKEHLGCKAQRTAAVRFRARLDNGAYVPNDAPDHLPPLIEAREVKA